MATPLNMTCPLCQSIVSFEQFPPRITEETLERLEKFIDLNSLNDTLTPAEVYMNRLEPERIQTACSLKQSIDEIQMSLLPLSNEIKENQMKFLIELKSTDDSKLRKTVDEFIAAQTDLQGRQRSEFLARLDAVLAIDIERMKDYREIVRTVSEIKERLMGTGIGQANEILTILNLKKICPWDRFDEAKSKAEGMDIIAWVFDKGSECGRISISVEYDLKWHELFIQQLSKNMEDDACRWGLLVSKSFPQEALNPRFFVTTNVLGRNILLIKPELAPLAYLAARHVAIYWKGIATAEVRGQERLQKSRVREAIDQWLYEPEFATDLSSISDAQKEVEEMGSTTRAIREYLLERVRRIDDYCSKILAHLARCRTRLDGLQNRLDESKQLTGIAIKVCPK